jgi:hypothetical protein
MVSKTTVKATPPNKPTVENNRTLTTNVKVEREKVKTEACQC